MTNFPTRNQIDRAGDLKFDGVTHGDDPQIDAVYSAKREHAREQARRAADTLNGMPLADVPDPPAQQAPALAEQPDLPTIEIQTTVEHRGRSFTVVARGYTLDQLCDMLDKRGYAAPAQTQEWQRLPDGTPICPKHHAPMRQREKQGDSWWSHNVGTKEQPVYCKGYHGKDSPGYEH